MLSILKSSVMSKLIVASTGLVLVGFVTGHMLGHLQMFIGQDAYNAYAQTLQNLGGLLWLVRIFLIVCVVLHIIATIQLTNKNKNAKAIGYQVSKHQNSTFSSRFMIYAGLAIMFFVIYHLLHFTLGVVHPEGYHIPDALGRNDVYGMMVIGFKNPVITLVYSLAVIFLGLHLNHGIKSMFQTLGLNSDSNKPRFEKLSMIASVVITLGYISVPVAILLGLIGGNI